MPQFDPMFLPYFILFVFFIYLYFLFIFFINFFITIFKLKLFSKNYTAQKLLISTIKKEIFLLKKNALDQKKEKIIKLYEN